MDLKRRCPRCGEGRLLSWAELDQEQREVVRRLTGAVDETPARRETSHRWCPRCWYESSHDTETV
jgi:ribosomal protein S27AE